MFLSKHSNGVWYLIYTNEQGKRQRVSTHCKYKLEALKFFQSFKRDEYEQRVRSKRKLCSEFLVEFLSYAETNLSRNTITLYKYSLKHFVKIVGDKYLSDYTPRDFDIFKSERLNAIKAVNLDTGSPIHIKPTSVNVELRTLKSFFNVAVRWKLLEKNPFQIQLVRVPEESPTYLTRQDFEKLIVIIKENWLKELIIFAIATGLRRGELLNLQWNNVDLPHKLLQIESSPTFKTKAGKRRTIPINDIAFNILQSRQGKNASTFVFAINGKVITGSWLTHRFKHYVKKANLSIPNIHWHSLRHTFGSWLVQQGTSIYFVKDLMGHSSVQTTQGYAHNQAETMRDEINKIKIGMN